MHKFDDRRFFAGLRRKRTFYLHVVKMNEEKWLGRPNPFRDYLRTHKEVREKYSALKKELSQKFSNDRYSYTDAKNDFIKEILRLAKGDK